MKKRIALEIAYDGTNYCGWQVQPNGLSVQEVINKTLRDLLHDPEITTTGASRTDAGVHALGNVAIFDTDSRIPGEKFSYALNQRLPQDIRIRCSWETQPWFHPLYHKGKKTYEYKILNTQMPIPTERLYSYHYYYPLDISKMQEAAEYLKGTHDFQSFCGAKAQVKTTVRTIYQLSVTKEADMITIRIMGDGFLYNMVRIIAGTLIEFGSGKYPPAHMRAILDSLDRSASGPTAPAHGLTLKNIDYNLTDKSKSPTSKP